MILVHVGRSPDRRTRYGLTAWGARCLSMVWIMIGLCIVGGGCGIVPRSRMDTLPAAYADFAARRNARLKDRILAVQGAESRLCRARPLTNKLSGDPDDAIERMERSVLT